MGDFLSVPNKDKESEDNENNDVNIHFLINNKLYFQCWILKIISNLIQIIKSTF
jgi:hypothetical protein